jgi:hypothetical protein
VQGRRSPDECRADQDVTIFLAELGEKIADLLVTLLVLPGSGETDRSKDQHRASGRLHQYEP